MSVSSSSTSTQRTSDPFTSSHNEIKSGPDSSPISTLRPDTSLTDTGIHTSQHKHTTTSPSPLAQAELPYDSEDPIYSGEPVPPELLQQQQHLRSHSESAISTAHPQYYNETRRRKTTAGDFHRRQIPTLVDNVDKLDASDVYGGGAYHHHESPYDCVLPSRNTNAQAPVLAFQHSDEINYNSTRLPFRDSLNLDESKYAGYHHNSAYYMDSFLEGSTAYGVQPNFENNPPKRNSLLKRISTRRRHKENPTIEEEDGEQSPKTPTSPKSTKSRIEGPSSPTKFGGIFPRKLSQQEQPNYPPPQPNASSGQLNGPPDKPLPNQRATNSARVDNASPNVERKSETHRKSIRNSFMQGFLRKTMKSNVH